jgi:hypothetical protein
MTGYKHKISIVNKMIRVLIFTVINGSVLFADYIFS